MEHPRVKSGILGLDPMLGGGFVKNSTVAVAGGTGSGRTTFVMQFLCKGAAEYGEPGLFISFDQQKDSLYSHMAGFGWDLLELEKHQKLMFVEYPQNELAAFAEQESALKDLINSLGIKRVAIDSITSYALMFSSTEERRMNTLKLVSAVKGWKVTTLICAETVHGPDNSFPHTVSGVESFADGFIYLSYFRSEGRRVRGLEIVKMRGCRHEHETRPAHITEHGFVVGSLQAKPPPKKKPMMEE